MSSNAWRAHAGDGQRIRQGYFVTEVDRSVRVRLRAGRGTLTIKGRTEGSTRTEFEYDIPADDAAAMLDTLVRPPEIDKTRYLVPVGDLTFEIDVFHQANADLVVAEVELPSEDTDVPSPDWLGDEVTDDPRYYNANLVDHPFSSWSEP